MDTRKASRLGLPKVHWKAPAIIVVAYIFGLVFAVAHHGFYSNLNGKAVDADNRLFGQQINIAIGTAFAFLVRASLLVSIGATYWQVFWGKLLHHGRSLPVSHLDSLAGLLGSLFEFSNVRALLSNQGLALLAVLSWLLPLTAVLPPATLAVENTLRTEPAWTGAPVINFTSNALMKAGSKVGGYPVESPPDRSDVSDDDIYEPESRTTGEQHFDFFWPGSASPRLIQLANSVFMEGAIPSFQGAGVNMTYELQFAGPAVQCLPLQEPYLEKFRSYMERDCGGYTTTTTIVEPPYDNTSKKNQTVCGLDRMRFRYMSWESIGYFWNDMRPSFRVDEEDTIHTVPRSFGEGDVARSLFVATRTWDGRLAVGFKATYEPWSVLNCSLHHAIYTANVSSSASNISDVVDYHVEILNAVAKQPPENRTLDSGNYTSAIPPSTLPGAIVNGYMAMLSGLSSIVGGYITDADGRTSGADDDEYVIETDVRRSTLMYTRELLQYTAIKSMQDKTATGEAYWALTDAERASDTPYTEEALAAPTFNQTLGTAIEAFFQNFTLSLLSKPLFIATSSQRTKAETQLWPNVYTYRQSNLLISYGVALGLTLIACLYGCITIFRNEASYSNAFSTVLRTTRGYLQDFEMFLTAQDRSGADPLHPDLAKARIQLGQARSLRGPAGFGGSVSRPESQSEHKTPGVVSEQGVAADRPSTCTDEPERAGRSPSLPVRESGGEYVPLGRMSQDGSERSTMMERRPSSEESQPANWSPASSGSLGPSSAWESSNRYA